ncbi:MAG: tetratricopeptide (TPR) repeat protein, partial [Candidatus Krumholzibacteriia bacterium]
MKMISQRKKPQPMKLKQHAGENWNRGILVQPFRTMKVMTLVMKMTSLIILVSIAAGPAFGQSEETPNELDLIADEVTADEDVPYGVAAGYIMGHRLLQEGNSAEALPYLHMAYRAQPEVVDIAVDFQAALVAEGYVKDALEVIGGLVAAYPDSLKFIAQRVNLNLQLSQVNEALTDLRFLRDQNYVTLAMIDAEASILASDGKTDQALDVYRDGLHLLPNDAGAIYLGMSRVLQKAHQEGRIADLMDEALLTSPDDPRLWLVKIRVLAAIGEDEAALAATQDADTHFASLLIEEAAGSTDDDRARAATERRNANLPPDSFVVELADFHAQRGDLEKALEILTPLSDAGQLQLTPSLWLARLQLGTGRVAEGSALIEELIVKWPEAGRAWYLRGKATEAGGDWATALPAFAKAVTLAERDPEIRLGYVRAMLVVWEGDIAAADPTPEQAERQKTFSTHLAVAGTIVPEQDLEGQLILGYGFKAVGDYDAAQWRFGLAAEDPNLQMNARFQKSICHDLLGEEGRARRELETLQNQFPRHPEVANSLGYFLAEKGEDLEKAESLVAISLAAEPGNGAYLDSMGWIHYRNGELEKALDFMIQAVNVLPDDPVILEHLGMVLKGQGKREEAL